MSDRVSDAALCSAVTVNWRDARTNAQSSTAIAFSIDADSLASDLEH